MLDPHLVGTRPQCEAYLALVEKALKLPWDSVPWGGGRHADPATGGQGWSDVQRHPKQVGLCAVKILQGAPTDALSVAEVQAMGDAEAAGVELDETWKAKEAEALPK